MAKTNSGGFYTSLVPFTSWRSTAVLAAVLGVAGATAGYLSRQSVGDFYSSASDGVLTSVGLGMVPVALWLMVFLWSLAGRRSWLRRPNLWLGSVALVAFTLGVMGFFQPADGALAGFTRDGEVSLGGRAGDAVAGSATWLGVLQLLGIFAAGVTVTAPSLAAGVGMAIGKVTVYAYVFSVLAVKGITHMYRPDSGARRQKATASTAWSTRNAPPEEPTPYTRVGAGEQAPSPSNAADPTWMPQVSPPDDPRPEVTAPVDTGPETDQWVEESPELEGEESYAESKPTPVREEAGTPQPATGKFNRLWASYEPGQYDSSELHEEEDKENCVPADHPQAQSWSLPSTDLLLEAPEGGVTDEEMEETAETIRKTLSEYGVEVGIGQVRPGPTVTMYGLTPGWVRRFKQVREKDEDGRPAMDESGRPVVNRVESKTRVKVDSILSREKDLALALKTPSIRIETPVMGESLVGIEVPNPNPSLVTLRSVMETEDFARLRKGADLPVALGKASGGETVVIDLARMPHLLIAGATGSGKSACINSIISCLIMEKAPSEMRLLLIDPKRVELTPYNGIPHLLTPVVVETDQVVGILKGMIREMLDRYRRMEEGGVRNIEAYNDKVPEKMPLLVVAIDELADLMMSASFDVEQSLCRLAQLGRATGIHLIVATQRPSVDVVTGLIKANFPSRISFAVTSYVDSRTILDTTGADKLLGRGDMLYLPLDASRPERAQGVFISDREIETLVRYWQATPRASLARIHLRRAEGDESVEEQDDADDGSRDELLDKAIELAHTYNKLSTSLLQRRMRVGYPRAARLMDQLEEQGIVGPSDGSKSRDVIMNQS